RIELLSTQFQYLQQEASEYRRRILSLQLVTIVWMSGEAAIAIFAATRAHSVALLGFGADSGIELLSALVVFLRFKKSNLTRKRAARITGALLFGLAAFILASSTLAFTDPHFRPEPSYLGVGLLIGAGLFMHWLAGQKRKLAGKTNSGSLKADAVQSSMCAYLAWIALGGLILNVLFKLSWADPAAALLLLPIVVREGWEALQGKSCVGCDAIA